MFRLFSELADAFKNQLGSGVVFCHVAFFEAEFFIGDRLADDDLYFSEKTYAVIFRLDVYGEHAAFCSVREKTDAALGIVGIGLFVGDAGALREQTDVFAVLENVDGGIDRLEVSHAAVDGDRTERAEDLCENGIFEKLFFGKEIDLALEIDADEEDVVHADVVGADDASGRYCIIRK